MGAWSVSITGNDMARDLKMDYSCAFYRWKRPVSSIGGNGLTLAIRN